MAHIAALDRGLVPRGTSEPSPPGMGTAGRGEKDGCDWDIPLFPGRIGSNRALDVAGGPVTDFSENHLKNYGGFDYGPCDGGNFWMSQAYLSRGDGPVGEMDDPYHDYDDRPSPGGDPQYYVRETTMLDTDSEIKDALMTYGALDTSMWWDPASRGMAGARRPCPGHPSAAARAQAEWPERRRGSMPRAPGRRRSATSPRKARPEPTRAIEPGSGTAEPKVTLSTPMNPESLTRISSRAIGASAR